MRPMRQHQRLWRSIEIMKGGERWDGCLKWSRKGKEFPLSPFISPRLCLVAFWREGNLHFYKTDVDGNDNGDAYATQLVNEDLVRYANN
jgi:hypothetical protein